MNTTTLASRSNHQGKRDGLVRDHLHREEAIHRGLTEKYELVKQLGSGGMGVVWEARHKRLGRSVALKYMRGEIAADTALRERFLREAVSTAALESEHIRAVYDIDTTGDEPYLVMELLTGSTLRTLLDSLAALDARRAIDLLAQACLAVAHAHSRGVVHRDLKPTNIFVCRRTDGTDLVKVADFGIAKLEGVGTAESLTGPGPLGTIAYMAPEQIRSAGSADESSDIYSLGVVLYEALAGQLPHPGQEMHEVMHHALHLEASPLVRHRPDLDPALCAVVHRAIASHREHRFRSATELRDALLRLTAEAEGSLGAHEIASASPSPGRWRSQAFAGGALGAGLALGWLLGSSSAARPAAEPVAVSQPTAPHQPRVQQIDVARALPPPPATASEVEPPTPLAATARPSSTAGIRRRVVTKPAATGASRGSMDLDLENPYTGPR